MTTDRQDRLFGVACIVVSLLLLGAAVVTPPDSVLTPFGRALYALAALCQMRLLWLIVQGTVERDDKHFHLFAFHRHPDWHGHCGHSPYLGEPGRCRHRCRHGFRCFLPHHRFGRHRAYKEHHTCAYFADAHTCRRWHFHGPFSHRHTDTGR